MRFLRTAPTSRLLAVLAGVVLVIVGGSAIAVAAGNGGPVPPPKPLARAIHSALSAPAVQGVTARVTFTNHLIDSSDIQGVDPLLKGASGRVWISSDHRARLELQSDNGDAQAVLDNGHFWAYDPARKTVYEGSAPAHTSAGRERGPGEKVPPVSKIQAELRRAARHLIISGAIPGDIAGQADYSVRVAPRRNGGLLGGLALAWDAARGVPLSVGVYARGDTSPVLEFKVSDIHYGAIAPSVFAISPPGGAKVVKVATSSKPDRRSNKNKRSKPVSGVKAVAQHLSFTLDAPATLAGRNRQEVRLLGIGKDSAALLTYGQGLDGIAVLEQKETPSSSSGSQSRSAHGGGDRQGVTLPTISVNGTTADQVKTPLGTLVHFTRGGVSYTVLASAPADVVAAAARGL
jgi:outer membrane lipoprotein-sorting protein